MMQQEMAVGRTMSALKKNGKLWIALVGLLMGAFLLLFGGIQGQGKDGKGDISSVPEETQADINTYRAELETRIKDLCSYVSGVGEVTVAVSLEGGYAYEYATDIKDTAGGISTQHILVGSGGDERPLYITRRVPVITGIGVVCEGGHDLVVQREIVGLLSAAFGVGSHKIYVTGGG